jgi:hypothetical protein
MAGEQDGEHTPNSEGAADTGGETKLIFGKYKTQEEAEKGYKELERKYHEGQQNASRFEERLELLENSRGEGYGRGQAHAEHIPQDQTGDNSRILTEFYQNPTKVLTEVEERATLRAEQRIADRQSRANDHAARVQAWTEKNQDVVAYGDLLTHYVGQTDARLSPETRLSKAADKVRARVLELKGKPVTGEPQPDDVVEGVDRSGAPAGGRKAAAPGGSKTDPESELASYATSRNRTARKPLGQPRAKA